MAASSELAPSTLERLATERVQHPKGSASYRSHAHVPGPVFVGKPRGDGLKRRLQRRLGTLVEIRLNRSQPRVTFDGKVLEFKPAAWYIVGLNLVVHLLRKSSTI